MFKGSSFFFPCVPLFFKTQSESGISDIAATLFATPEMVLPTDRSDLFVATFPAFSASALQAKDPGRLARAITLGPLESPLAHFELAEVYGLLNDAAPRHAPRARAPASPHAAGRAGADGVVSALPPKGGLLRAKLLNKAGPQAVAQAGGRNQTGLDAGVRTLLGADARPAADASADGKARRRRRPSIPKSFVLPASLPSLPSLPPLPPSSSSSSSLPSMKGLAQQRLRFDAERADVFTGTPEIGSGTTTSGGGGGGGSVAGPRVLYAVLAREDSLATLVVDAVSTWASGPGFASSGASVLFFYSLDAIARQSMEADDAMRRGLSAAMQLLDGFSPTRTPPTAPSEAPGDPQAARRANYLNSTAFIKLSKSSLSNLGSGISGGSSGGGGEGSVPSRRARRRRLNSLARRRGGHQFKAPAPSGEHAPLFASGAPAFQPGLAPHHHSRSFPPQAPPGTAALRTFHPRGTDPMYALALEGGAFTVSLSENLAPRGGFLAGELAGGDGSGVLGAEVRLVGLPLPPQPAKGGNFYAKSLAKPKEWNLWLRAKVAAVVRFLTATTRLSTGGGGGGNGGGGGGRNGGGVGGSSLDLSAYDWAVVVDDDTYVKVPAFVAMLGAHDPSGATAVGRKFFCEAKGSLLGGGPGIALSRGALAAIRTVDCPSRGFPVISHAVPGGDGWMGQCMAAAGVTVEHDFRFKSLPPFAYPPNQVAHAVSFHKSHVREVHAFLFPGEAQAVLQGSRGSRSGAASAWARAASLGKGSGGAAAGLAAVSAANPPCLPVLLRDLVEVRCLPLFTIIGAQKAGTTSLFEYLGQHPQVQLPANKELNFYGTPWPLKNHQHRLQSLSAFTFSYLNEFKLSHPGARVITASGEASPDYLISTRSVLPNILRFSPSSKVIVSLRDPLERAVSAYQNKVRDRTVHRHLDERLYHGHADARRDDEVPGYVVPSLEDLAERVSATMAACPAHAMHHTLAERPPGMGAHASGSPRAPPTAQAGAAVAAGAAARVVVGLGPGSRGGAKVAAAGARNESATEHGRGMAAAAPAPPNPCYVNPFVLHGYYARYLRPWAAAFGGSAGNLLVVDFDALEADGAAAMATVASFLGLRPFNFSTGAVYNSRKNPGVHRPNSRVAREAKIGGVVSGVAREELGQLADWTTTALTPRAQSILRAYYAAPNAELKRLLVDIGAPVGSDPQLLAWLRDDAKGTHLKPEDEARYYRTTKNSTQV